MTLGLAYLTIKSSIETGETGQIITTTSSSTRRALEKQLDQAIIRQTEINTKVDVLNEQLFEYETEIVEVKSSNDIAGELGPLKYLSGLTGIPMDKIINYLLLTIIFVFDPLAIALVIAANFAFEKLIPKTKNNIYGEKVVVEDDGFWTEEEMEDFNEQFNADDLLPDEDDMEELHEDLFGEEEEKIEEVEENPLNQMEFDFTKLSEKDWEIVDEEKPISVSEKIEQIRNSKLSSFGKRKAIRRLKNSSEDDLTITY